MDSELRGDAGIATPAMLQRRESREEPSLLLVQGAEIELAGVGQFRAGWRCGGQGRPRRRRLGPRLRPAGNRGRGGRGRPGDGFRRGSGGLSGQRLPSRARSLGREVEVAVAELDTGQPLGASELAQGIGRGNAEDGIQFLHQESGTGCAHEVLGGGEQGAARGEADAAEGPQAVLVEACRCAQGVEAPAMGIAGDVRHFAQLADDGAPAGGTEGGEQLGHGDDTLATQQIDQGLGMELNGSHEAQ